MAKELQRQLAVAGAPQSHLALLLVQAFLNRASAEKHKQRSLILDTLRSMRQKRAEEEFQELEQGGKRLESGIDWGDIPF